MTNDYGARQHHGVSAAYLMFNFKGRIWKGCFSPIQNVLRPTLWL